MGERQPLPIYEVLVNPSGGPYYIFVSIGENPAWFRKVAAFANLDRATDYAEWENNLLKDTDNTSWQRDDAVEPPPNHAEPQSMIAPALRDREDSMDAIRTALTRTDVEIEPHAPFNASAIVSDAPKPPEIAETATNMQSATPIALLPAVVLSETEGRERLAAWLLNDLRYRSPEISLGLADIRDRTRYAMLEMAGVDISLPRIREAVESLAAEGKVIYRTVHRDKPMVVSLPPADPVAETFEQPNPIQEPIRQPTNDEPPIPVNMAVLVEQIMAWLPDAIADDPKGPTVSDASKRFDVGGRIARDAFHTIRREHRGEVDRRCDTGAYHLTPIGYKRPLEDLSPLQEEVLGLVVSSPSGDGVCRLTPFQIAVELGRPQGSIGPALEALRKKGYLEGSADKKNHWHKPIPQTKAV